MKNQIYVKKINPSQILAVKSLFSATVLLMFLYLYFVNSAAFNAAAQENFVEEIHQLQTSLNELEFNYMEKSRGIEKDLAVSFGLREIEDSEIIFVQRDLTTRLSFNE